MSRISKVLTGGILFIGLLIFLFITGLRSCLSKYDERCALPPVAYVEKDGNAVLFSIVEYSKTTSYSRSGSMTHKSVSDEYYVQCNDAVTGKKLKAKEIDLPSRPKHFPMEILGVSGTQVWVFVNQLMAFDAFTLEKIAEIEIIEEKNPSLKGRMPAEKKYYEFNRATGQIRFKLTDGSPMLLDTRTLAVKTADEDPGKKPSSEWEDIASRIEQLDKMNVHFSQMKLNQDTVNGQWLGMYSPEEFRTLNERIYIHALNGDDQRRQLLISPYDSVKDYRKLAIKKDEAKTITGAGYFLEGGFLAGKTTGTAIRLDAPESYLVVHKDQIGQEGKIIISRVSPDGRQIWKFNTGLKQWIDWQLHGKRLYIFGNDNRELSSSQCNVLQIIDLDNGSVNGYDYFTDKNY